MKTKKEFLIFRQSHLREQMRALEEIRLKGLRYLRIRRNFIVIGIILLFILVYNAEFLGGIFIPIAVVYIGVFVYTLSHYTYLARKLNFPVRFRYELLAPTIAFISEDLTYYPRRTVPVNNFKASRMFNEKILRYSGNDYVEGKIDKTAFHFSELFVQMGEQGYNGSRFTLDFMGMFFVADFHKNFEGTTVLVPRKIKSSLQQLKKSVFNKGNNEVALEHPEIKKHFICLSTDDIMARYILSPLIQKSLAHFKRNYPKDDVYFSFVHNHVFVAINHKKDLFYPTLGTSVYSDTSLTHYFEEIALVVSLIESLNLNTRIWTRK